MSFKIVTTTLSAALAASGTVTLSYPTGTDEDTFTAHSHKAVAIGNDMNSPGDFTIALNSASFVFTYASGKTTLPAGTVLDVQLNLPGPDDKFARVEAAAHSGVAEMKLIRVNLGSPLAVDPNGISVAASPTGTGNLTLGGALAAGGTVDLMNGAGGAPYGRNVTIDSGGADTAVLTVTGTDWQGKAMSEAITLNGTTEVVGKKAFGKISQVAHSATISNGAFVGSGLLLGLPFYLSGIDDCPTVGEFEDNTIATAGTFLGGVDTAATTTTGDVRGTYAGNSTPDGAKNFVLFMPTTDPNYHGVTQA